LFDGGLVCAFLPFMRGISSSAFKPPELFQKHGILLIAGARECHRADITRRRRYLPRGFDRSVSAIAFDSGISQDHHADRHGKLSGDGSVIRLATAR
jgi:hypothetical protein